MNKYEVTLVLKPELSDEQADSLIDDLGVEVTGRQKLGRRLFAYPINKQKEGNYILCDIATNSANMKKLDQTLRLNESVIRYLVIAKEEAN